MNYSISSEIFDSQKTEIKTGIINKSEDDKKFGNIVFCDCNLKSTKMINLILNYLEFVF